MTARYVSQAARPRRASSDGDLYELQLTLTVHEPDPAPVATGILDAAGVPIFRVETREPIGFQTGRWK